MPRYRHGGLYGTICAGVIRIGMNPRCYTERNDNKMLNQINIAGRLCADPELRRTGNNIAVATFRIACEQDYKPEGGEQETDFISCVAWRSTAEFVSRYFSKGKMAIVSGRLQIRPYMDKDGNKRTAAEVVADRIYFGESRSRDENTRSTAPVQSFEDLSSDDSDLPF